MGLFFKDDVLVPKAKVETKPGEYNFPPAKKIGTITGVFKPTTVVSRIDPEIREALEDSMKEQKLGGFDYLKFKATLEETSELASDEGSRYKMAAIAAKQLGVNKAKLIETANHYLNVLSEDSESFQKDLKKKIDNTVGKAQERISQLENNIQTSENAIKSLQEGIEKATAEHNELTSTISNDTKELETKKQAFEATAEALKEEIQTVISNIGKYL